MAILVVFKWLKIVKVRPFLRQKGSFIPTMVDLVTLEEAEETRSSTLLQAIQNFHENLVAAELAKVELTLNRPDLCGICHPGSFENVDV